MNLDFGVKAACQGFEAWPCGSLDRLALQRITVSQHTNLSTLLFRVRKHVGWDVSRAMATRLVQHPSGWVRFCSVMPRQSLDNHHNIAVDPISAYPNTILTSVSRPRPSHTWAPSCASFPPSRALNLSWTQLFSQNSLFEEEHHDMISIPCAMSRGATEQWVRRATTSPPQRVNIDVL